MTRRRRIDPRAIPKSMLDDQDAEFLEANKTRRRPAGPQCRTYQWVCGRCQAEYATKIDAKRAGKACCAIKGLRMKVPAQMAAIMQSNGIPIPRCEYAFAQEIGRQWRFDWAWPERQVALEVSGGGKTGGHRRGEQSDDELLKYSTAAAMGWRLLHFSPRQIGRGIFLHYLQEALR